MTLPIGQVAVREGVAIDPHLHEKHEQWLREQYLRDLAALDRIEFQNACFFDAMGMTQGAR